MYFKSAVGRSKKRICVTIVQFPDYKHLLTLMSTQKKKKKTHHTTFSNSYLRLEEEIRTQTDSLTNLNMFFRNNNA